MKDWGSKEVAVHKKDATARLAQLTLTAHVGERTGVCVCVCVCVKSRLTSVPEWV
jgi:hypothetical protein